MQPDHTRVRWLFIDMNSFFASAEQHLRPDLRGRPVGVIPVQASGTCVIAASPDAKARGVRTGTRVPEARRLCPSIQLVKARPSVYVDLHHQIAGRIDRHLPIHKAYSIDEWAVRLTGAEQAPHRAVALARAIKDDLRETFSSWLASSIGLAPTRLLAKIACELNKPDGLTLLRTADLPEPLEHLGLQDLCGVSKGLETRLHRNGVRTVRQLWGLTRAESVAVWGSVEGGRWWAGFHGIDEPEIQTARRSMGHANVLEPRFRTDDGARQMLIRLTHRLCVRLRDADLVAGRISVHVRDANRPDPFEAQASLPDTQSTLTIMRALYGLWDRRPPLRSPIQLAVTLSSLTPRSEATLCLFADAEKEARLSHTIDVINKRWGLSAAYLGSMSGCRRQMDDKIAFGRVPNGVLRGL